MADNESGARRPPPPPGHKPTGERRALMPPPPPGARRITGTMPAVSPHKATLKGPPPQDYSFQGAKPAPEQPQPGKAGTLRERIGDGAYRKLASALIKLCNACNLDKAQFMADGNSVIFRNPATFRDSRMPVEFFGGKPEIRIYLDDICPNPEKEARCRDILREFGAGGIGDPRTKMLSSLNHIYIRVTEDRVSLCGSNKRDGQPLVYLFLNVQ